MLVHLALNSKALPSKVFFYLILRHYANNSRSDASATTGRSTVTFCFYLPSCKHKLPPSSGKPPTPLSTPLIHLSKSNHPPSDAQAHLVTEAISERVPLLQNLDSRISELEGTLSALRDLREVRAEELRSLEAVNSPLRLFPAEILREVFSACIHNMMVDVLGEEMEAKMLNPRLIKPSSSDSFRIPWTLAAVCRRWRDTAVFFRKFWSFIPCIVDQPRDQLPHLVEQRRDRIALHLSRSSSSPLSLFISSAPNGNSGDTYILRLLKGSSQLKHVYLWVPLVRGLNSNSAMINLRKRLPATIQTLHLTGYLTNDVHMLFPVPSGSPRVTLPFLRCLSVKSRNTPPDHSSWMDMLTAPSLVNLKICMVPIEEHITQSHISAFLQRSYTLEP